MPDDRLHYLLEKYHAGTCTPDELQELENWYKQLSLTGEQLVDEGDEAMKEEMLQQFRKRLPVHDKPVIPIRRNRLVYRIAAAAAVLIALSVSVFYLTGTGTKEPQPVVKDEPKDILPGGNHAMLTLADGSNILLDSAKYGALAEQGMSSVKKEGDGVLVYEKLETSGVPITGLNLVRTPRGGQYQVQLPDGTVVWLNAASSIQFPVSFDERARRVTITGEVYFEVARNVKKPFIVAVANKGEVEVLGTHFNINAYDDELAMKTTLLEGKVKVSNNNKQSKLLLPGQQAQINDNQFSIFNDVDVEEAVAWKNGLFKFNDADIQTILRQAARWYDVEVEIKGNDPGERFRGKISRDVKLSEFLRILEINQVSFQLQGKKLIIQL